MGGSNAGSSIRIYSRMGDWRRGLAGVNGVRRANGEVEELGAGTVFPARVQSYRRQEKLKCLVEEMIDHRIFLDEALDEFEKRFIQTALTKTHGNQTKAAEVLGVRRNTLNRKIVHYKLNGHQ
ncbi:MAG: hypothetical protein DMG17_11245 [Acidobacteria bacterium]|nr:MAG: hypothetical protein DMG17_11245 [Acidobacteriota bacterium]